MTLMTLMTLMTWVIVLLLLGDEIGEVGVRLEMDRGNGQTRHSVALAPAKPRSDVGHFHRGERPARAFDRQGDRSSP